MENNFDGKKYFNPWMSPEARSKSFFAFLKVRVTNSWSKWPDEVKVETAQPVARVDSDIKVTFVGHSTFLIQTGKLNILLDPVWAKRASPFTWIGPKRAHEPGIRFEDLPHVDLILVSHDHYDHMDIATLKRLAERDQPLIITGMGNAKVLAQEGIKNVRELGWWESLDAAGFKVHFVPAQHFSGRWLDDRNETLWGGFVIVTPDAKKIYYAGDTGYGPFFKDIHARFGDMDLSFIPIGAYRPRDFFKDMHNNPDDAVLSHLDVGSKQSIACHFGTFQLTAEEIDAPAADLKEALAKHGVPEEKFLTPKVGGEYRF